jgi:DNA-binding HxlR family transcriptional regulator
VATSRSYGDACGIARALDVVGERWALLVVRELLLGPQRFSDLRRALPLASSNLVADRLRELAARDVVRRRTLPPPAASRVYELTEWGRLLEPVVLALGTWGLQAPFPPGPTALSPASALIYLRGVARPDPAAGAVSCRVELGETVWAVRAEGGRVQVAAGEPAGPDAAVRTDPRTLVALVDDPPGLDAAVASGAVDVTGDPAAVRTLLAVPPAG